MNMLRKIRSILAFLVVASVPLVASATEPCGDFGECKVLVEINSSDGDIGFHFLMDGDDLKAAALLNPRNKKIFSYVVRRELRRQKLTETFAESAEPLCFDPTMDDDPDNDGEDFVTLADFLDRWQAGTYRFFGINNGWGVAYGESELTFDLPAAPVDPDYEDGVISWAPGDDLGECSDGMEMLPMPPGEVPVAAWEVVMEPDVDGLLSSFTYVVRIAGDAATELTVPEDYLASLPPNTPVKIEVGAIGIDDNATFTEADEFCVNETEEDGCGFDDEEDEEE